MTRDGWLIAAVILAALAVAFRLLVELDRNVRVAVNLTWPVTLPFVATPPTFTFAGVGERIQIVLSPPPLMDNSIQSGGFTHVP